MSKKSINKQTAHTDERGEPRYVCENWDPKVSVIFNGRKHISRKVVTNGVWQIHAPEIIDEIKEHLRMGQQVRIDSDILFSPIMEIDLSKMYVSARTIGGLRDCLADKKTCVTHCGEELDDKARNEFVDEYYRRREEAREEQITPDTMVTCPKCGTRFRVGRKN